MTNPAVLTPSGDPVAPVPVATAPVDAINTAPVAATADNIQKTGSNQSLSDRHAAYFAERVKKNRALVGIYASTVVAVAVCSIACLIGLSVVAAQLPFFDRPQFVVGAGAAALSISLLFYWLLWQKSDGETLSAMTFWSTEFSKDYDPDDLIVHPFNGPLRHSISIYDKNDCLLAFVKQISRQFSEIHMANGYWQVGPHKKSEGRDIHWTDLHSGEQIFIGKLFTRMFGFNRLQLLTGGMLSIQSTGLKGMFSRTKQDTVMMAGKPVGQIRTRGGYRFSLFDKTIPQSMQVLAMAMMFGEE